MSCQLCSQWHLRIQSPEETDATNELIDDITGQEAESNLLSAEEIHKLRAEGVDGAEIIRIQEERHDRFKLKTEFSKEKWRKRKEKKSVHLECSVMRLLISPPGIRCLSLRWRQHQIIWLTTTTLARQQRSYRYAGIRYRNY